MKILTFLCSIGILIGIVSCSAGAPLVTPQDTPQDIVPNNPSAIFTKQPTPSTVSLAAGSPIHYSVGVSYIPGGDVQLLLTIYELMPVGALNVLEYDGNCEIDATNHVITHNDCNNLTAYPQNEGVASLWVYADNMTNPPNYESAVSTTITVGQ